MFRKRSLCADQYSRVQCNNRCNVFAGGDDSKLNNEQVPYFFLL